MQRHFAVAVHNYHFVLADTPFAAGCWRKFATEHTPFVEHKPLAEPGRLAFEAEALEAQLLQLEPELLVASRLAVVGQPRPQQELEQELQDAQFFDVIEPGCWP